MAKFECPYCHNKYWQLTKNHLAKHNKTIQDLYEEFPETSKEATHIRNIPCQKGQGANDIAGYFGEKTLDKVRHKHYGKSKWFDNKGMLKDS